MVTKKQIDDFLGPRKLAIAGVSRNPSRFGHVVFRDLKKAGYDVYAVNPAGGEMHGNKLYSSLAELPEGVDHLLILTPRQETDKVLREAIGRGIKHIWVQQFSETAETIRIASEYQVDLIHKKCIFMFAEPVQGIHKFHRTLTGFFGRLPK